MGLSPKRLAGGREHDAVGAAVVGHGHAFDPARVFHAIDQPGDIGTVDDQDFAELALSQWGRRILQDVQHVELGFG